MPILYSTIARTQSTGTTPPNIRDSIQSPTFRDSVLFPIPASYFTNGSQRPAYKGAFQPRLGFSYALDDEGITTLFGGFGVFYDRDYYNATLDERFRLQYRSEEHTSEL